MRAQRIRLKVCGMREPGNIREVARLKPDYMGFIFYKKSPRNVKSEIPECDSAASSFKRVGVFVNEDADRILDIGKNYKLDIIQLHGEETVTTCEKIKNAGLGVIKVFRIDNEFDFKELKPYVETVDYFLFDTKGKYYGGNSISFDWSILENYDLDTPFFLSGGIDEGDIQAIRKLNHPKLYAVDINSRFEINPGLKNKEKIKRFKQHLMQEV